MVRKAILSLQLGILTASPLFGQEWAKKMFETTSHDFGTIARGAKAEYEFVLKNIYVKDIHIASVRVSCSCTTPRITKPLLKTYEKGAIVASINSDRFLGRQGSTITVTIDTPTYANVQLHVKAFVQSDVVLQPASVQLGSVDQDTPVEKMISVSSTSRIGWKILDVKSANPHLSGRVVETARQGSRVSYELRVRLDEHAPPGYINDHLILVTNDQRSRRIPVTVEGRVLSAITVNPTSLFLGVVQPGQQVTKLLVVRSRRPFRITSITADCGCLKFDTPAAEVPKLVHLVPITFVAGDASGKVSKTLRIETDQNDAVGEVSVYAVVTADQ
ncbi:MAG: hypothetical protein A2V70_08670 [Planctomycetes bacterium RBG_13_63_9]|nr:MAG: hypothetical protein A2V70_08670 [Planctomycetes bacterium RBG_13_63_9]